MESQENTAPEDMQAEGFAETQFYQMSLAANTHLEISFSKLSYTRLEFLVPAVVRGYKHSLYYRAPDDSYSFMTAGKIHMLLEVREILKKNPGYLLGLRSMPRDVKNLIAYVPLLLFHQTFENGQAGELWSDFSDTAFVPRMVLLQLGATVYSITYRRIDEETQIETEHLNDDQINELPLTRTGGPVKGVGSSVTPAEKAAWLEQVGTIQKKISSGEISKAVLSRVFSIPLPENFTVTDIIKSFRRNPDTHRFLYRQGNTLLTGASPEKLLSFRNGVLSTEAIAGTVPRGKTPAEDDAASALLLNSHKERNEHQIVVRFILSALRKFTKNISMDETPVVRKIARLIHLYSPLSAEGIEPEQVPDIMESLFPTPATCGEPKLASYELIKSIEAHDRGLYCGQIGWVTIDQAVESFVPLRVSLLKGDSMTLFSGCGIVAESDAENELTEVIQKADSILTLFANADQS